LYKLQKVTNYIYMLFAGWEVRIVKNCDRGLENAARGRRLRATFPSPRSQFFTIRTNPKPVNNLFIFTKLSNKETSRKKTQASVTVILVRDRKIQTTLRTNQIVGFITVPAWKKITNYNWLFIMNTAQKLAARDLHVPWICYWYITKYPWPVKVSYIHRTCMHSNVIKRSYSFWPTVSSLLFL